MSENQSRPKHGSVDFNQLVGSKVPEWLQKIGMTLNLGIVVVGPDNRIIFHNPSFINHCNLPAEIIGHGKTFEDWMNFMADRGDFSAMEGSDSSNQILTKLHDPSKDDLIASEILPPNGFVLQMKCLSSSGGYVTLFSEDITQRKRNEESLDLALEMGKSGYFYLMSETGFRTIQSNYLKHILTEQEFQSLHTDGFWDIIHPEDVEESKSLWTNSVLRGQSAELAVRLVTEKSGTKIFNFYFRPISGSNGKLQRVIGFFEDITQEHNVRSALRNAKDSTEEALKSKTQFLARISHEIRTPMNAVIGIADALIHHNKNPEIVPKLELIQSSADNILNTLDATLNHSKLDSDEFRLTPKPSDPRKTISNVCQLWESKAQANNTRLNCQIEDSVPYEIIFDKHRYEQCLNNLMSNAIKFSPGGQIDIIATRIDKNGQPNLVFAIKDTGIGMTEEQKARIFEPFKQGDDTIKRRFGGTGLGMNITKNIIEKMGGRISVKSEIGKGSIFVLTMPINAPKAVEQPASQSLFDHIMPEDALETPYERLKILVADDNPTNHMVIKSLLDSVVAEIYIANDGQEVLDVLKTQEIDIVLMDIHMPVMDGIESTLAIRSSQESWSDVLIIAVTADPQYQQQRLCMNIGMDFAVAKPVKLVDMLEAFDQVLSFRDGSFNVKKTG